MLLLLTLLLAGEQQGRAGAFPRPDHTDHARLARWLAHTADWGSLSTSSSNGDPIGGVVSVSDGDDASGRLFFYLTPMDETAQNLQRRPECALTITEAELLPGGCGGTDPEDPTCAKVSVLGRMLPVPNGPESDAAAAALFSRHPAMKTWPADHGFKLFELHVKEIHMLSWYGGMAVISAEDYYGADLAAGPQRQQQQQQRQQRQAEVAAAATGIRGRPVKALQQL